MGELNPTLDLEGLPKGLAELYMKRYETTFPGYDALDQFEEHTAPMLAMLVASRGPVSIDVVRDAGIDLNVKQKRSFKAKRLSHLEFIQRMCVGSLVDVGLLQFSHKSFSDWLNDKNNEDFRVEKEEGEKLLAEVCHCCLLENDKCGDEDGTTFLSYALTHGIAHLVESGRKDDAKKLLLDVKYLLARSNDGVRLMEDCKRLQGDRTMEVLNSALGLSLSDIRKDPKRIVGQLVGRLMWTAGVGVEEKEKDNEKNETKTATKRNGNIKNNVENEIQDLRNRLMEYEYDFDWWGVTSRTMEQAGGACVRQLLGHENGVCSVDYSSDGRFVVSGSGDKTVRIWDVDTGECVKILKGHTGGVRGVSFSPNNQYVISGSIDKTVRIWDVESGDCIKTLEGHTGSVTGVSFSPNNQYVVSE